MTEYFVEKNYAVLVMDYRTYGKSTGTITEKALYNDAQFCYEYLKKHYDEKDITEIKDYFNDIFAECGMTFKTITINGKEEK